MLERTDQPLAEDLPLMREVRAALDKCLENGLDAGSSAQLPYPGYPTLFAHRNCRALYSGCYGLGSRDLQPEGLIGAIENMLPSGPRRSFYLPVDGLGPRTRASQGRIAPAEVPGRLSAGGRDGGARQRKSQPDAARRITVRMHSIGGWGAITTGKNLAMTLFDLLGWDIKANPKYGSEKKGQPTTYYLSAAPEPIRVNSEYVHLDVVLSPDPAVFGHSNPLTGLKKGGVFIIQSNLDEGTWAAFPRWAQQQIVDQELRVFYLDAFQIAREEAGSRRASAAHAGQRLSGRVLRSLAGLRQCRTERGETVPRHREAARLQIRRQGRARGRRTTSQWSSAAIRRSTRSPTRRWAPRRRVDSKSQLPIMLKRCPEGDAKSLPPVADIHRFWEQTGDFYATGKGNDNLLDPFIGASLMPAATGIFRDMTGIRFEHPEWSAEKCTACGKCYTVCPDSALPGLVNSVSEVFATALNRVERGGAPTRFLRRALRGAERKLRALIGPNDGVAVRPLIDQAIAGVVAEAPAEERDDLKAEFELLKAELGDFAFAATKPYWNQKEKKAPGSGGLFSITVNPLTCKGCALCVEVCEDDALRMSTQTEKSVTIMRRDWSFWLDLPTTSKDFCRIDSLDEKIGALETLLLDKSNYNAMKCGDGAAGLRRKDVDPSLHQHRGGADAAPGQGLRDAARRSDPAPRAAHAAEAGAGGGPVGHRRRRARRGRHFAARSDLSTLARRSAPESRRSRSTRPGSSAPHSSWSR